MARAMDQDVLPVLLALREMRRRFASSMGVSTWHGVLIADSSESVDIDLIVFNGETLVFCECKDNGSTLTDQQLTKFLSMSDKMDARPYLACIRESFRPDHVMRAQGKGGFVLSPSDLLTE